MARRLVCMLGLELGGKLVLELGGMLEQELGLVYSHSLGLGLYQRRQQLRWQRWR